ncbi:hypothetical protein IQ283_21290 [Alkalihalobacillus hwajinpoensis]|nr:hypothetical protein [Pseudalkalibacillus hwajinpoensis]
MKSRRGHLFIEWIENPKKCEEGKKLSSFQTIISLAKQLVKENLPCDAGITDKLLHEANVRINLCQIAML